MDVEPREKNRVDSGEEEREREKGREGEGEGEAARSAEM